MPITVFQTRGIPNHRRERIEAAVVAGGKHVSGPHEGWITADPFRDGFKVLITGPLGFERMVALAHDDEPAVIAERVRETVEEEAAEDRRAALIISHDRAGPVTPI